MPGADAGAATIIAAARQQAQVAGVPVGLVVVDTTARALAGDNENEAAAFSALFAQAAEITKATGATVLFVHHCGKDADRGPRGSYNFLAGVDALIAIDREPGAKLRQVTAVKVRDGEEGPVGSFTLKRVVVGHDKRGREVTSCTIEPVADPEPKRPKRPAPNTAAGRALNELDHLLIDGKGKPSRKHPRIPDGTPIVKLADWREACLTAGLSSGDPESEKRAFRRALDDLRKAGVIQTFDERVWQIRADKSAVSAVHGSSHMGGQGGQSRGRDHEGEETT
jgi:hypothetical protein